MSASGPCTTTPSLMAHIPSPTPTPGEQSGVCLEEAMRQYAWFIICSNWNIQVTYNALQQCRWMAWVSYSIMVTVFGVGYTAEILSEILRFC